MAIGGKKLTKLKSVLKKWNSFSKTSPRSDSTSSSSAADDGGGSCFAEEMQAVFVGKSRRRYLVRSSVVAHPVFRELAERSGESPETINVACEVVLFEHFLWMLQNADPQAQPESLAEFYSC